MNRTNVGSNWGYKLDQFCSRAGPISYLLWSDFDPICLIEVQQWSILDLKSVQVRSEIGPKDPTRLRCKIGPINLGSKLVDFGPKWVQFIFKTGPV